MSLFRFMRRRQRDTGTRRPGRRSDGRWEYLSPHSALVRELRDEVVADARRGHPDPVDGTAAPEVFGRSNATFAQLVQNARKAAAADCADDVAFLVGHASEFLALQRAAADRAGAPADASPKAESSARLIAEVGRRLGAREEQHEAALAELRHAADSTTALLKAAWEAHHPHPDHLGHFPIPAFVMPENATDIGQRAVRHALTNPHNNQE